MAAQTHGAEFLLRRLQRAAAIPAAERSPDVAAFVESVQLLREAGDLLPLTSDGRPALQLGSALARQQATLALLKAARADYICPCDPVCDRKVFSHFEAYGCRDPHTAAGNLLTTLVLRRTLIERSGDISLAMVCGAAASMLDQLADPAVQQGISRELAQLAAAYPGQPLLTFKQLHHICCCAVGQLADEFCFQAARKADHQVARSAEHRTTLAQHKTAAAIVARVAATLVSLEPQNPKSYDKAGVAEMVYEPDSPIAGALQLQSSTQLFLQGARLAQQQGNAFFTAQCAAGAVTNAAPMGQLDRAGWQEALLAFGSAEAAVRACKRLLPAPWVTSVVATVELAQRAIRSVEGQMQSQHTAGFEGAGLAGMDVSYVAAIAGMRTHSKCDGCGEHAVGLRRCARCKSAQYCSTECQRKHWRTHKQDCCEA